MSDIRAELNSQINTRPLFDQLLEAYKVHFSDVYSVDFDKWSVTTQDGIVLDGLEPPRAVQRETRIEPVEEKPQPEPTSFEEHRHGALVGIALPSRGVVQSRTCQVVANTASYLGDEANWYFAHSRPIPECFNEPLQSALDNGCEYLGILEEDMEPPMNWVYDLLSPILNDYADITFYDYPLPSGNHAYHQYKNSRYKFSGTGCVMAKADTWKELLPFRIDTGYLIVNGGDEVRTYSIPSAEKGYGYQDVDFYMRAIDAGFRLKCVGEANHYKTIKEGSDSNSEGFAVIGRLQYK